MQSTQVSSNENVISKQTLEQCRTPRNLTAHCKWLGSTERSRNNLSSDATCVVESMVEDRAEVGKNRSLKYTTCEGKQFNCTSAPNFACLALLKRLRFTPR